MDYRAFYAEIAEWVYMSNTMATKHGMDSNEFWMWVMKSAAEICEKYNNNPLVTGQMVFMYSWLEEIYAGMRKG